MRPSSRAFRAQGCVVVGKANLHEFAYGVTSVNPTTAVAQPARPEPRRGGSSAVGVAVRPGMMRLVDRKRHGRLDPRPRVSLWRGRFSRPRSLDTAGVIPLSHSLDTAWADRA